MMYRVYVTIEVNYRTLIKAKDIFAPKRIEAENIAQNKVLKEFQAEHPSGHILGMELFKLVKLADYDGIGIWHIALPE